MLQIANITGGNQKWRFGENLYHYKSSNQEVKRAGGNGSDEGQNPGMEQTAGSLNYGLRCSCSHGDVWSENPQLSATSLHKCN